ncbi:sensor histidine kinase [Streptomyces sp. NBC_00696]|uniref:sensor histidine kinase n=1 Tax=Streptomyces sp. NBC_00696 TaxID=2903672 RepID=UPI002E2EDCE7|nr:histidine kinase [Streptomyces sp. NBC_00696]
MGLLTALRGTFARVGRATVFNVTGAPLQLLPLALLAQPWLLFHDLDAVPEIQLAALTPLLLVVYGAGALTAAQRRRFASLADVDIPLLPVTRRRPTLRGAVNWLRAGATWRQVAYHLFVGPAVLCGTAVTFVLWGWGVFAGTALVWMWGVPPEQLPKFLESSTEAVYINASGLAALLAALWLTPAVVRLDTRAALALLGPSRTEQLARRVEDLTESRAGAIDAADAERRRIERDLHDGAQQRLVSLAVNLGIARATLTDLSTEARQVIEEAHREAKEAIDELNNLVRGLHPAVLDDRGLDAALSGIAARGPLPVRLHVDVPRRLAPTVEAVAYFTVSEALANITKHAPEASRADVTVGIHDGRLRVTVADDGPGGADPAHGSGLAGLARRAASVDGVFTISSPVGGPTVITVELPCVVSP